MSLGAGMAGAACALLFFGIFYGVGIGLIVYGGTLVDHNKHLTGDFPISEANCTLKSVDSSYTPSSTDDDGDTTPASATCYGDVNVFPLLDEFEQNSECMFAGEYGCECDADDEHSCRDPLVCINQICSSKRIANKLLCIKIEDEARRWSEWEGESRAREACPRYLPKPRESFQCYYAQGLHSTCGAKDVSELFKQHKESVFTSEASLRAAVTGSMLTGVALLVFGSLWTGCLCMMTCRIFVAASSEMCEKCKNSRIFAV